MGLQETFETVTSFLEENRINYAVIGGFALYGFGYVRATRDIDFVVRLEDQSTLVNFLLSLGFETIQCSFAFSNHVHPIGNLQVDFMYVAGKTADQIFSSVQKRIIFRNKKFPVVSAEHLIAMKLFAASNNPDRLLKDLADVKEILNNAEVDKNTIEKLFKKYKMEKYYGLFIGND
ncbi:MAG: nucleotidyltransferase family protein [Tissierellales bacterium]|nr:nucleotidyltransferase family protein [Tissierellales bacterium]